MGHGVSTELQSFKADFFKALAHPLRVRILELLRARERNVHELQAALDLDQPAVSSQLAVLRRTNVVGARKEGTTVRYALRDPLVGNHLVGTQDMLRALGEEARRPRRR